MEAAATPQDESLVKIEVPRRRLRQRGLWRARARGGRGCRVWHDGRHGQGRGQERSQWDFQRGAYENE
eukprot:8784070-Pyramimonas_sp.AAC.1